MHSNLSSGSPKGYTTALHIAADKKDTETVKALLAKTNPAPQNQNINVNRRDPDGNTALHIAADQKDTKTLQALLADTRTDVNLPNGYGYTALHIATDQKDTKTVQALLADPHADVNLRNTDGYNALHIATFEGSAEIVNHLLAHPNIDVNCHAICVHKGKKHRFSSLIIAEIQEHTEIAQALRDAGADSIIMDLENTKAVEAQHSQTLSDCSKSALVLFRSQEKQPGTRAFYEEELTAHR
jgi:ankyrin repeat protein